MTDDELWDDIEERRRTAHRSMNFVTADQVALEPPRADLVRRQDVIDQVGRLVDIYQDQQRGALATVGENVTQRGYLSDGAQIAERRKLTRLYLLTYSGVSGLTMAGLSLLAWLAGADGVLSLAGWMTATGALTLGLTWVRHGDEFAHSPEGIARHLADWYGSIAQYESETRRLSLQWEYGAEERRQLAAAQAAADARGMAALRLEEMETRRRTVEAQNERRRMAFEDSPGLLAARSDAIDAGQDETYHDDAASVPGGSTPPSVGESWHDALVMWIAGLYGDGATTDAGIVKGRVPWAARSAWCEGDKAAAKRVCCDLRPALIVPSDGGRWRLRLEMFDSAELALQVLAGRLE